jgi:5-methylcytosine-specific restriction endonuclease McrA
MPGDPFYSSPRWLRLRGAVLRRAKGKCEVPGCGQSAVVVDHIISRRNGGHDCMANLRALCRQHDNNTKEDAAGKRRSGGIFKGCDEHGNPLDPAHPWNQE